MLGSKALNIPPQTSTIASHLPKAVGAAYSIGAARRHRPEHQALPDDAIVCCSVGDASANHSTAQGAFNTAGWTSYQSIPMPSLFVCEDNGIGMAQNGFVPMPEIQFLAYLHNAEDQLRGEVATLVAANWRGMREKSDFQARQAGIPLLISMGRDDQRPLVAKRR